MCRSLVQPALRSIRPPVVASTSFARRYATPVEYKPPQKDPQLGDYPQLPFVSTQLRPPQGWWDIQMRRNFGEVVHEEDDVLNMWSPDAPPPVEPSKALFQFTIAALAITTFGYFIFHNVPERPSIPREYPFSGLVKELGGVEENKAVPEELETEEAE